MDEACSMYGGERHTRFRCAKVKERDHLKDLGVGGRVIRSGSYRNRTGWRALN